MPEPEPKPESKPSEKPEEKPGTPPEGTQPQAGQAPRRGGKYIDYNALTPEEAAIMLKRIRARINSIRNALSMMEEDLNTITNILKFGANAGTPSQGQGQQAQQGQQEQGGYSRGYRRGNYGNRGYSGRGSYGGRSYGGGYSRYSGRRGRRTSSEEDEDVNY
jgi:hypothetical protein